MELRDNEVDAVPLVPPSRALATAEARARTAEARAGAAEAAAAAAVADAAAAVVAAAQKEAARQHLLHLHGVHAAELAALRVEVQRLRQEMTERGGGAGPGGELGLPSSCCRGLLYACCAGLSQSALLLWVTSHYL